MMFDKSFYLKNESEQSSDYSGDWYALQIKDIRLIFFWMTIK